MAKANGLGLPLCVNYWKLDTITVFNHYPLPLIQELQDRVQDGVVISKLESTNSYNLIRMKKGEK